MSGVFQRGSVRDPQDVPGHRKGAVLLGQLHEASGGDRGGQRVPGLQTRRHSRAGGLLGAGAGGARVLRGQRAAVSGGRVSGV